MEGPLGAGLCFPRPRIQQQGRQDGVWGCCQTASAFCYLGVLKTKQHKRGKETALMLPNGGPDDKHGESGGWEDDCVGVKGHFQHASRALYVEAGGPLFENPSCFCFVSGSSQERTL